MTSIIESEQVKPKDLLTSDKQRQRLYSEIGSVGIPRVVAIIPDGNRRWAKERGLSKYKGHLQGAAAIQEITRFMQTIPDVKGLMLWGMAVENFNRPPDEVAGILNVIQEQIIQAVPTLMETNGRLIHLGDKDLVRRHSSPLWRTIANAEEQTRQNTQQILIPLIGFSGTDQHLRSDKKLIELVRSGQRIPETDTPEYIDFRNSLRDGEGQVPPADLLIRTGDVRRLSDIGWIVAPNTYIQFENIAAPELTISHVVDAMIDYSNQEIRSGK